MGKAGPVGGSSAWGTRSPLFLHCLVKAGSGPSPRQEDGGGFVPALSALTQLTILTRMTSRIKGKASIARGPREEAADPGGIWEEL